MTTAPAGGGAPSARAGKSTRSAEEIIVIERRMLLSDLRPLLFDDSTMEILSLVPTIHDVVIFSLSVSNIDVNSWPVPSGCSVGLVFKPLLRTYTAPPTAPALQATWAISERPPHF